MPTAFPEKLVVAFRALWIDMEQGYSGPPGMRQQVIMTALIRAFYEDATSAGDHTG